MKSQLFIPSKIEIGFQNRSDTYSGKLGYITYKDDKGVLKKEKSWEGWRDKKIKAMSIDNVPTEGFVLNRNVGGASRHSWDSRLEKIRVWDPRGFEIEITIPNMLFLLEGNSSIPGKGLSGEYVYSWDGQMLVLLPTNCKEYAECTQFTELQSKTIASKDLVEGHTYETKAQQKVVYLGYHNVYGDIHYDWGRAVVKPVKRYIFYQLDKKAYYKLDAIEPKNLALELECEVHPDFSTFMEYLSKNHAMSGNLGTLIESPASIMFPGQESKNYFGYGLPRGYWKLSDSEYTYNRNSIGDVLRPEIIVCKNGEGIYNKISDNEYRLIVIKREKELVKNEGNYVHWKQSGFKLSSSQVLVYDGNNMTKRTRKFKDDNLYSMEDIEKMGFINLKLTRSKGKAIDL